MRRSLSPIERMCERLEVQRNQLRQDMRFFIRSHPTASAASLAAT